VPEPGRADSIEAQTANDYREPTARVVELVEVDAGEPVERLLYDVFRFAGVIEHPPRESDHSIAVVVPQRFEARVGACPRSRDNTFGVHGNSAPLPKVVLSYRRDSRAERDIASSRHISDAGFVAIGMHLNDTHPSAISVRRLTKTWAGGVEAVKGIDFEVATGEVFGLLGPNGAGKSTTVGMLTTTIRPTSGSARVYGHDVAADAIAARAVSAVVFQDPVVDRALTGRRNVEIHARLWGVAADDASRRIENLTESFDLAAVLDRPVGTYSGGQRRRLEIARALVSEPRVLFLDEPTVGLDPRIRFELIDIIGGLRAQFGATVLLTTHYLDEAERLCDRVGIMHEGRIVALDRPANLLAALGDHVLELRVDTDPTAALARLRAHGVAGNDSFALGATLTVPVRGRSADATLAAVRSAGLAPVATSTRPPTLDDVYLRLTGATLAA